MVNWMTFKLEHMNHVFEHSTAAFANSVDRGSDEFDLLVTDEADRLSTLEQIVDDRLKDKIEERFEKLQAERGARARRLVSSRFRRGGRAPFFRFEHVFDEKVNHVTKPSSSSAPQPSTDVVTVASELPPPLLDPSSSAPSYQLCRSASGSATPPTTPSTTAKSRTISSDSRFRCRCAARAASRS